MKSRVQTVFRFFMISLIIILVLLIVSVLIATAYLLEYAQDDVDQILSLAGNHGVSSSLYALSENGERIEYGQGELSLGKSNDYAPLEEIPETLQKAFIAIEDKRFYSHIGFDLITTVKAAFKYVFSDGPSPGGSTITQQLIKNLTGEDELSVRRKITEIMRAVKLEKQMSKDMILELYLNCIYLSQGTYGVKAAAKYYFNKDLSELTLTESAAIAAITQSPTKWDPLINPDNNQRRRNVILGEMLSLGYISEDDYDKSVDEDLLLDINRETPMIQTSSWYTDAVINESIQLLSEAYGISQKAATQYLYNGGYRITTAINLDVQAILEKYYQNSSLFSVDGVQSSFVVIDPQNGHILGLVGGLGEKTASRVLNRATQSVRSPGSAIKPISVYLPAIENGVIHAGSAFDDIPTHFVGASRTPWPENASRIYEGLVSLEYAIARSLNTVSVQTLERIGIDTSYSFLESLEISTLVEEGSRNDKSLSALALGGMTKGTTLLELVGAYTVLANNGIYREARCVLSIIDANGHVVVENKGKEEILAKEENTEALTKLLTSVIHHPKGTAHGAVNRLLSICEVAGKTGTTSKNHDRLFVGYTPYLVGGIWLGYDDPKSLSHIEGKKHIQVWDSIMTEIHGVIDTNKRKAFTKELLCEASYCSVSGKIPTEACYKDVRGSSVKKGFFTKSTLPSQPCDSHILTDYCTEGMGIASNACPTDCLKSVGLLLHKREFQTDITVKDAEYTVMTLPAGYLPCYNQLKPYYQNYIPSNTFVGIPSNKAPYNRFCSRHFPAVDT